MRQATPRFAVAFPDPGETWDVVFDAVGRLSSSQSRRLLKEGGMSLSVRTSTNERVEDLLTLKDLAEAGEIEPVIDRRYSLERIAEAHAYVETGHKRGNAVITFDNAVITFDNAVTALNSDREENSADKEQSR